MSSNKIVAIVDPYSSGSQLAREAKLRGHAILMVQSEEQVPTMYRSSFCSEEFAAIIRHQGDLEKTSNQLRTNNVDCVIAGCEMGVELSDSLSQRLGLASNGTRLSRSRRNKRLMGEALRERRRAHSVRVFVLERGRYKGLGSSVRSLACRAKTSVQLGLGRCQPVRRRG